MFSLVLRMGLQETSPVALWGFSKARSCSGGSLWWPGESRETHHGQHRHFRGRRVDAKSAVGLSGLLGNPLKEIRIAGLVCTFLKCSLVDWSE